MPALGRCWASTTALLTTTMHAGQTSMADLLGQHIVRWLGHGHAAVPLSHSIPGPRGAGRLTPPCMTCHTLQTDVPRT